MFPRVGLVCACIAALACAAAFALPLGAEQHRPAAAGTDTLITEGERLAAANRLPEAAAIAQQVLADRPESARAHYLLGLVRDRERRFDDAVAAYRAAIAQAPNMAEAH